ncbi:MAG: Dihydroorotase [Promethearchaeota archaeon]|nr:MAG: Dihydroorotase [Candidatus Lokiarchaeota archaeon]
MILKNGKFYQNGFLIDGALLIEGGVIKETISDPSKQDFADLKDKNEDGRIIECKNKIILPGIIDCHTHLRDMSQEHKETFRTATKAAAFSGITTVFNMPNTDPPAITSSIVQKWMNKAKNNIYVDVGFIAGIPKQLNPEEIKNIIDLGVVGFKMYPHESLNGLDWTIKGNIQLLLQISSRYKIRIFIHPQWPRSATDTRELFENYFFRDSNLLKLHDKLFPCTSETQFVQYVLENYENFIKTDHLSPEEYPIVHFCHISCKDSYSLIKNILVKSPHYKISYEVTPHHIFLSNEISLSKAAVGKVMPPLRDLGVKEFFYRELRMGNLLMIATDHAPHTLKEKAAEFLDAPSGFPGLETYPLLFLHEVTKYKLSLVNFVKIASENPAKVFHLQTKGFIEEGYDADLLIIDKCSEYKINPSRFHSKSKISPYEGMKTNIEIWKVFLRGIEINIKDRTPIGKIIS